MADQIFEHPDLARIYDPLDPDRSDLDAYLAYVEQVGAKKVLDVGCGTGSFAVMLAQRGVKVLGVDPALESLKVAKTKPDSSEVVWIHGVAGDVVETGFDVATMTANVAQAITEPNDWHATLTAIHRALRPGGTLMFESRVPAQKAWLQWNREETWAFTQVDGVGGIESWTELIEVDGPLVSFRHHWIFPGGSQRESNSTLRFRERDELEASLAAAGYLVAEVRDAPDRPGLEYVFIATPSG